MAQVITAADPDMVLAAATGNIFDQRLIEYFNQSFRNFQQRVGGIVNNVIEQANQFYSYLTGDAIQMARDIVARTDTIVNDHIIHEVNDYNNVGLYMRRFIAAEPFIYRRIENNALHGWGDIWYDPEPNTDPYKRQDYKDVVTGSTLEDEDGDEYTYFHATRETELSSLDKMRVRRAWRYYRELIDRDIDPTDIEE